MITRPPKSDVVLDLSHWQTVNDWAAIKAAGLEAVILKASQGTGYVDPTFADRRKAADGAGLLVGAYHFLDGTNSLDQVSHFLSVAEGVPRLFLDAEPNSGSGGTVTIAQAGEAVSWLEALSGRRPCLYMGRYGPDGKGGGLPNPTLSRCALWLPAYTTGNPTLPKGWSAWTIWQYTDSGTVPGVPGPVDRSYFAGTVAELRAWWAPDPPSAIA